MKFIALDTETTGLSVRKDRIIEIGCVEIKNNIITGKKFHFYLKVERRISNDAYKIHGITNKFLENKLIFKDIFKKFKKFIKNSKLVMHNSKFDLKFLEKEFKLINHNFKKYTIIDTLKIARRKFPGKRNSLSSLCKKFRIFYKKPHGALKDAEVLAQLFCLLRNKQTKMNIFKKKIFFKKYIIKKKNIKAKIT